MKNFIYALSLILIISSSVLMVTFPESLSSFLYAGGILTLAIPLNIYSYITKAKKQSPKANIKMMVLSFYGIES